MNFNNHVEYDDCHSKNNNIHIPYAFSHTKHSPMALLADECIRKCNGATLKDKPISVSPYSEKKELIKPEKKKKEEHAPQIDRDDPFYVSSSDDEDDEEDKPNKDGIFPNRVLVVSKLSKKQSWEATMESLQTKFNKIGKVSNIRMPKQGR